EDGIRDRNVTGVQTCALPISAGAVRLRRAVDRREPGLRPDLRGRAAAGAGGGAGDRAGAPGRAGPRHPGAAALSAAAATDGAARSEERRVGKARRTRWWA